MIQPIVTSSLSVHLKKIYLLNNISFSLQPQQSLGILGVNGAGKSTLLKTILGFIPNYTGRCLVNGYPPSAPQSRQHMTFLPERAELPAQMKGFEYLQCQLTAHHQKLDSQTLDFYATGLNFERIDLKRPIKEYSKGMLQKLMLLGMFLPKPQLMILDEAMSGLDMHTRPQVRHLLQLYRKQGGTLLFTTHLWEDIQAFATHLLVLDKGHLQYYGPPQAFKESFEVV